jgi:hypothetical protein
MYHKEKMERERSRSGGGFADGYCAGGVGQWDDLSASASVALGDAWPGSETGLVKSHGGTVPGGPVEWLACAAAWLIPDAIATTAGDTAAINVIASRASTFDFMLFLTEASGLITYESRFLNARSKVVSRKSEFHMEIQMYSVQSRAITGFFIFPRKQAEHTESGALPGQTLCHP